MGQFFNEFFVGVSKNQFVFFTTFLSIVILLRYLFLKVVNRSKTLEWERKRRIFVNTNSLVSFILVITFAAVWSSELKALAFSFVALGVALVLATKEIIACAMGSFYRISNNMFHIGDRIFVNGVRGDVIDKSLFSTKLLEIGPGEHIHQYTGRLVTIPNSYFYTHSVKNESYLKDYVLHTFTVSLLASGDWKTAEKKLLEAAKVETEYYKENALKYFNRALTNAGLDCPKIEPRVHIDLSDFEQIQLIVRVTVPSKRRGEIEQKIIHHFLESYKS